MLSLTNPLVERSHTPPLSLSLRKSFVVFFLYPPTLFIAVHTISMIRFLPVRCVRVYDVQGSIFCVFPISLAPSAAEIEWDKKKTTKLRKNIRRLSWYYITSPPFSLNVILYTMNHIIFRAHISVTPHRRVYRVENQRVFLLSILSPPVLLQRDHVIRPRVL